MRTWSSPFGPLGTPLLDRDDPAPQAQLHLVRRQRAEALAEERLRLVGERVDRLVAHVRPV